MADIYKQYSIDTMIELKDVYDTKEGNFMKSFLEETVTSISSITYDYYRDSQYLKKDVDLSDYIDLNFKKEEKKEEEKFKIKKTINKKNNNKIIKNAFKKIDIPKNLQKNGIPYVIKYDGNDIIEPDKIYEWNVLNKKISNQGKHEFPDMIITNANPIAEVGKKFFYKGYDILYQLKQFGREKIKIPRSKLKTFNNEYNIYS
jgi:hypothetical protein